LDNKKPDNKTPVIKLEHDIAKPQNTTKFIFNRIQTIFVSIKYVK